MRFSLKALFSPLWTIAAVSTASLVAQGAPAAEKPLPAEIAVDYTYMRSNAPPAGCGCFMLNGGSGTVDWSVKPDKFALVADLTITTAAKIDSTDYNITLGIFTVGARYRFPMGHSRIHPYAQGMAGGAHASGSLTKPPNPAYSNASLAFAANLGGGVDIGINRRFSWRVVEVDYLVTTFDNNLNNHQNNTRLSSGLVIHF